MPGRIGKLAPQSASAWRWPTAPPKAVLPSYGPCCWPRAMCEVSSPGRSFLRGCSRRRLAGRPLPWFATEKAEQGAFAAFLGVEIDAHKNRWTALAVGDCCLVHVDDVGKRMRAVETFPLQRSSQFTMSPYLIGSRSDDESLKDRIQVSKGSLRDGDMLLLATDAMAAWLLKRHEEGRPLWKWLYRKLGTPESFAAMVAYGRKNGLRNDDFTLVRVIHHDSRVEAKES